MAKQSLHRLYRSLRTLTVPIAAVIGFSCLLTFIFILYQPTPGPGIKQRLGWQSWEVITMYDPNAGSQPMQAPSKPQTGLGNVPQGTDWWNVTTSSPAVDSASLPLDQWTPLMPHDTGLSEIALTRCVLDPAMAGDLCFPDTTSEKDSIKGNWVRVPRNLNLEAGFFGGYLNLYYRRTRRQDIPLITEIRLLPAGDQPSPPDGWQKVDLSLRSGIIGTPPLFMWYHLGKSTSQMSAEERANLITELDVLYGDDVPWYGFERLSPATMVGGGGKEDTWITYRRGVKIPPRAPPLHFSRSGKFKILQVADLHYAVAPGTCRETAKPCDKSDNLTSTLLGRIIEAEAPDLVVFSGDQLNGAVNPFAWDPKSVLAKFAKMVTDKKIPWTAVFGNHDAEVGATREEQVQLMQALPYSLMQRGPKDVNGVGNYVLKVKSADASMTDLLTLYFLDSGSYSRGYRNFWGILTPTALDWIRQNQIDWFLQESSQIHPIERPFRPDTAKDIGHIWNRQQITPQTRKLAKPNAMMFFHIPLPESYKPADKDSRSGKVLDVGIHGLEAAGNAKDSDGFFDKGIMKALESDHVNGSPLPEVKVIGNGHCHVTENCRRVRGTWLCFGGGGSFSGYGKVGFDRRFRIYDISDYGETIRTWKRTENDQVIDEMVLSGAGAPPP